MELTEGSIQRLLQGNLTINEAKQMFALLKANPEWIENYFTESEWISFKETANEKLTQNKLQQTLDAIKAKAFVDENKKAKPRVVNMLIRTASVAAAILLLFIGGWWIHNNTINKDAVASTINDTIFKQNNTDTIQVFALSEGSSIELTPQASISYLNQFPKERRVINLVGNAFFKVAKDKHRPFEVRAAGFSTVALGTSFRVIANNNENKITVQLYTGKVVISKTDAASGATFNNVFLYPDQQLTINTSTLKSDIAEINKVVNPKSIDSKLSPKKTLDWDKYITSNQLQFTNTALSDVFTVIEHQYEININYKPSDVEGIVFSGVFKKADSVQAVLSTLTSINYLNLLKSGNGHFKITR